LVATGIYFVPELLSIITTPFAESVDEDLVSRASLWETLSLVRLAILILLSILLLNSLTFHSNNIKQKSS
jgi:hypothetical protein